jgi:hypothetical protein
MQDLDVSCKSYEWPTKMLKIMKEATSKASADHKRFEQELKARRKTFSDSLGSLQERVDVFETYEVSGRRAEHAREVRFLPPHYSTLTCTLTQLEVINLGHCLCI